MEPDMNLGSELKKVRRCEVWKQRKQSHSSPHLYISITMLLGAYLSPQGEA